ncbi:hypothetical protein [Paenibacillus marinisediminis]
MKQSKKIIFTAAVLSGGILMGSLMNINAWSTAGAEPGNAQDPLVTKSYVDQLFAKLSGGNGGNGGGTSDNGSAGGSATADKMEIVTIKPGQQIIANGGAEFVVRAGKSEIYSADASGVSDLTDGVDLLNGADVPKNHLLLFPRDGRGITAKDTPKNSVVVMVRGGYTIKNIATDEAVKP